jgi:hypothetical protein
MATPRTAPDGWDPREVVVKVSLDVNGDVQVDQEYFFVSKSRNQEVHWVCAQQHDHAKDNDQPCFSVEFNDNDSPFYEFQFNSDVPVSGLVRRDVLPSPKIYKYTVRIGNKSLDPGGGVQK